MKSRKKPIVRIPAFAKINLCLHVMGKRPDGYHELRTIFQAISLHDTLELSLAPGGKPGEDRHHQHRQPGNEGAPH